MARELEISDLATRITEIDSKGRELSITQARKAVRCIIEACALNPDYLKLITDTVSRKRGDIYGTKKHLH